MQVQITQHCKIFNKENTLSEVSCFRIYTVKEVADMLQIHTETVKNYIKEGKIKKIAASGAIRIEHTELEKFIKGE